MEGERIILFELNEVPFRVLDHYCSRHPASALSQLLRGGRQFRTHIEAKQDLSPWRTWPTVHRGVPDWRHQITNFGEDLTEVNQAYPPIWEILRRASVQTGVFNSLHTFPVPDDVSKYSYFVPDPFSFGADGTSTGVGAVSRFRARCFTRVGAQRRAQRTVASRNQTRLDVDALGLAPSNHRGYRGTTIGGTLGQESCRAPAYVSSRVGVRRVHAAIA